MNKEECNVKNTESGSKHPDGEQREQSKHYGPCESEGNGSDGHENAVHPEANELEEAIGQFVDSFESLCCIRLTNDIFKVNLKQGKRLEIIDEISLFE